MQLKLNEMASKVENMNYFFDVAVIGAGPAGSACGIFLQKNNISNCLIDNKTFPREKTCGGLITNKTLQRIIDLFQVDSIDEIRNLFIDSTNIVSLFYQDERLTTSSVDTEYNFVDRLTFDNGLVTHYKTLGGTIFEGEKQYSLNVKEKFIILSNGDTIKFNKLIVADGAKSKTRKILHIKQPRLGFCIETYVPKDQVKDHEVKVFFGIVPKGYGWVFPAGEKMCIGLGGVFKKNVNYFDLLENFLSTLNISKYTKPKGAFIPYGQIAEQGKCGDVALIGDAAGFVDPIYGEGLYFSISSGIEVAKAIIENNNNFSFAFRKNMKPYIKIIRQGAFLQKFFFSTIIQMLFKKFVKGKNSFASFYCEQQVSEYNYSYLNLFKLFIDYKKRKKK